MPLWRWTTASYEAGSHPGSSLSRLTLSVARLLAFLLSCLGRNHNVGALGAQGRELGEDVCASLDPDFLVIGQKASAVMRLLSKVTLCG